MVETDRVRGRGTLDSRSYYTWAVIINMTFIWVCEPNSSVKLGFASRPCLLPGADTQTRQWAVGFRAQLRLVPTTNSSGDSSVGRASDWRKTSVQSIWRSSVQSRLTAFIFCIFFALFCELSGSITDTIVVLRDVYGHAVGIEISSTVLIPWYSFNCRKVVDGRQRNHKLWWNEWGTTRDVAVMDVLVEIFGRII